MPQQTSMEQGHATTHESLQVYIEIYTLLSAHLLDMYLRLLLQYIEHLQAFFVWAYLAPSRGAQRGVSTCSMSCAGNNSTCQILLAILGQALCQLAKPPINI